MLRARLILSLVIGLSLSACGGQQGAASPTLASATPGGASGDPTFEATAVPPALPSPTLAVTATLPAATAIVPAPTATTPAAQPASWEQLAVSGSGPAPRRDAALVYDAPRNRLLLFGGRSAAAISLDDTWAFDLATRSWRELATGDAPRPPARFSSVAGMHQQRNLLLITTGDAGNQNFFNDVWALDLTSDSWSRIATSGELPRPRYGSGGGVAVLGDGRLYITHGFSDQGRFDDTWAFDLERASWQNITPQGELPLKRCLHDAVLAGASTLLLFGGCSSGFGPCPQGDTWLFDLGGGGWRQITQEGGPSARQFPRLVTTGQGASLLFGGVASGSANQNDVWLLDDQQPAWRPLDLAGTPPSGRNGHSMAWVDALGAAIVFGGNDGQSDLNDLWLLYPGV